MYTSSRRRYERLLLYAILACGLGIRLIAISQPFVDAWSWRQADVAMIAENFYQHGFALFYPQINWGGRTPGYVGTEFPLVPFIAAMLYGAFGVQAWIGRAVSVGFFALSVPFFYRLVRQTSNAHVALWAVGLYTLTPLSIFASRAFMPDMASLSLSLVALALFATWLERRPHVPLFLATSLVISLAILVKLPAILMGVPLLAMAWTTYGVRAVYRRELVALVALALSGPLAWYTHAYFISLTYPPYHFFGIGVLEIVEVGWYWEIVHRLATSSLTPIVSAAMLVGLFVPAGTAYAWVFHWWLLALLVFIVLVGWGNHEHDWYQLPLVPVAAAFAGRACEWGFRRVAQRAGATLARIGTGVFVAGLAAVVYLCIAPHYEPKRLAWWQAGLELNRITPTDALVLIADYGDPTAFYYSQRHGWHFLQNFGSNPVDSQQAIRELEQLRREGASFLVFTPHTFWWLKGYPAFREHLEARYRRMRETEAYLIFDIREVRSE
ncbi:MAG: ArnT family glycosyltransferase [Candidatus Entotheonellia bacterium]